MLLVAGLLFVYPISSTGEQILIELKDYLYAFKICILKIFSRKFVTSLFGMMVLVRGLNDIISYHLDTGSLVPIALAFCCSVTVISITYITGEAKIDLQANLQARASAGLEEKKAG